MVAHRLPRWRALLFALPALAIAIALPQVSSAFVVSLAVSVFIYGLLAMSLDLIAGYTGLVSLGHASFMGVAAYGVAYALKIGLAPWTAMAFAMAAAMIVGATFGFLAVRVKGLTFAILTLAMGQLLWGLAFRWVTVSGGDSGMPAVPRPTIGPYDLADSATFYYFVLFVWVVSAALLLLVVRSPFGLTLRGIRDNEPRMAALGYYTTRHKYIAFMISVFFAGVCGVLLAYYSLYVSPSMLDFAHNGTAIQMVIIGGLGTLWGSTVGAFVIVFLSQFVSLYVTRWVTIVGLLLIVVVLFMRRGIWGELVAVADWFRHRSATQRARDAAAVKR